ncbi:hypothetical protein SISNIDRAFT_464159 [Sistotremastrum niveocremeum HHB9708]|uniref:F-box domain-containing protein n=1 Tax=Sistotremastrum niveocremeum HHB9708 TaxID=1314777 RepID=A0A164XCR2_9AGAM|nr:hypothetical protein SISNIDRAFT_464159 [Sistotremastrum niveocremeum HHB9708]
MAFETIPLELLDEILTCYMSDGSMFEGQEKRLIATARLALINRRTRALALARPDIWRTIYLQWPEAVVQEYFQRAKESHISLYLDTFQKSSNLNALTINSNIQRWAHFLASNMASFEHMELYIRSGACQALSGPLTTPAPNLQTFSLTLGTGQLNCKLFSGVAPKLRSTRLDSCMTFELAPFVSLSTVTLRMHQQNCRKSLSNLNSNVLRLENVTLVGSDSVTDIPSPHQPHSVILPFCRRFVVKDMAPVSVRRLMSTVSLPHLQTLRIHETLDAPESLPIAASLSRILELLETGFRVTPTSLSVEIHQHRVIVETDGMPSLRYDSDWHSVHGLFRRYDPRVPDTVIRMITSILSVPGVRIGRLAVCDNIDPSVQDSDDPSALSTMGMNFLWFSVFRGFPDIETLEFSGHIRLPTMALDGAESLTLPRLTALNVRNTITRHESELPIATLERIKLKRKLKLWIESSNSELP